MTAIAQLYQKIKADVREMIMSLHNLPLIPTVKGEQYLRDAYKGKTRHAERKEGSVSQQVATRLS